MKLSASWVRAVLIFWRPSTRWLVNFFHSPHIFTLLTAIWVGNITNITYLFDSISAKTNILHEKNGLSIYPSIPPDVQAKGEQRASLHPVSSGPAAGEPGLPTGRTAAQLHLRDAEERHRQAVEGDRKQSRSSPTGPLSQRTWIVLAVQRAKISVSACALYFFFVDCILSISFFLVKFIGTKLAIV